MPKCFIFLSLSEKIKKLSCFEIGKFDCIKGTELFFSINFALYFTFLEQRTPAFPLKNLQCSRIY